MEKIGLVLVLSNTYNRFERANKVLESVGFKNIIHMPAVFVHNQKECRGTNGHRVAFRNMWRLAEQTKLNTCIFEDDIELTNKKFQARSVKFQKDEDIIFLGEFWKRGAWWTNHAACLTPLAAQSLLGKTTRCIKTLGVSIDSIIKKMCTRKSLHCRKASKHFVRLNGSTWWGDFYQNRSIPSYLHDQNNNLIV